MQSIYYILNEIIAKLDPQSSKWHTVLMLYVFSESSFSKVSSIIFDNKVINILILDYAKK